MATLFVQGIGLCGPGLTDWAQGAQVLGGQLAYTRTPTAVPPPARLPAAERRRAGAAIKIALAVADEACQRGGIDPALAATVFASSSGDGANCHALCEALAGSDRLVSPTRFTNSVHNAAAGYWHIAVAGRAASTSLCGFDTSFAAGLIEAAGQLHGRAPAQAQPVLLVASDTPYPEPLNATRPLPDSLGIALVLQPRGDGALARLTLAAQPPQASTPCSDAGLEALRQQIPAARALPLLELIARGGAGHVVLDCQTGLSLRVDVSRP
ncbi:MULTISPECIES: beta-ketoacyl synthase chain length factor [unclassified Rhizobacter]|uniref:beta-ketoacyl synthase chain length factor n=1 Tax=unclassified Rhizobacter TaxID=2640088 RepID=UPI0006F2255B|nr:MULTISPECIES: beta-ketoacyl synthase chain length factor [unclassified Rhizobacter]KQU77034.1 hypothetical protein ASC88_23225 [Rhizobacter sp. Root29]KQW14198.1 hypothetical protein ASC98_16265 [Rhizobacter sp. Root1238]KRB18565.1 hypothetical protein ASE08_04805 [Rhizobacter sp. Root16D2]